MTVRLLFGAKLESADRIPNFSALKNLVEIPKI